MPRNITVTDAQGNRYQPTWPKRAKGLVKHGRAVYLNETTICLTPPERQTEEKAMTANDILQKIFELGQEQKHIHEALDALMSMPDLTEPTQCGAPVDMAGASKAEAIADIVKSAEETRRQLLRFYMRVYDDLSGHPRMAEASDGADAARQPFAPAESTADPVDLATMTMKLAAEYE